MQAFELAKNDNELEQYQTIPKDWQEFYSRSKKFVPYSDEKPSSRSPDTLLFDLITSFPHKMTTTFENLKKDQLETINLIRFLLNNGANHSAFNNQGNTPLHHLLCINSTLNYESVATKDHFKELVQIILERGASLQTLNRDQKNPITAIATAPISRESKIRNLVILSYAVRHTYIDMKLKDMNDQVKDSIKALVKEIDSEQDDIIFCAGEFEELEQRHLTDACYLLSYICQLTDELSKEKVPAKFLELVAQCRQKCEPHFNSYFPLLDLFSACEKAFAVFIVGLIISFVGSLLISGAPSLMVLGLASAAVALCVGYASADFSNDYKPLVDTQLNRLEEIFQEEISAAPRI